MRRTMLAAGMIFAAGAAAAEDFRDYLCRDVRRPFFAVERVLPGGAKRVKTNRAQAAPLSFIVPAPPGTKRIFVVGESAAGIFWGGSPGQDALTKLAGAAAPEWKTEHLNCGMTAYNSKRIAAVLEEALEYGPDILVVMSGNNEASRMEYCPGYLEGVERLFRRSEAFRMLEERLRGKAGSLYSYERDLSLARHEWNLRRMVRAAKAKGKPVVLCTLPANLTDYAPWGAAPLKDKGFVSAWLALEKKDYTAAVTLFKGCIAADRREPFGHFFLAKALEGAKRPAEAKAEYEESVELDGRADRCSGTRNEMIRSVAREEGARVADLEAVFSRAAPDGLVGGRFILDGVHWRKRFNPLVARAVLEAAGPPWAGRTLEALPEGRAEPAVSPEEETEETRKLLSYAARSISLWAGQSSNGEILEQGVEFLDRVQSRDPEYLLKVSRAKEALRAAMIDNFWVRDLKESVDDWWPAYLQHLGETLRRRGEPGRAIGLLSEAARLDPGRYLIRLQRALAYLAAGRKAEARKDFRYLAGSAHASIAHFAEACAMADALR